MASEGHLGDVVCVPPNAVESRDPDRVVPEVDEGPRLAQPVLVLLAIPSDLFILSETAPKNVKRCRLILIAGAKRRVGIDVGTANADIVLHDQLTDRLVLLALLAEEGVARR